MAQFPSPKTGRSAAITIASSTSRKKRQADLICDGVADNIQILSAISALPSGGRIVLLEGTFNVAAQITDERFATQNIVIEGQGPSTIIDYTAAGSGIFSASAGWTVKNLAINAAINLTHNTSRIVDCVVNGVNTTQPLSGRHVIDVGADFKFKTLYTAYSSITDSSDTNRYLIRLWGKLTETRFTDLSDPYIEIEGHGAILDCNWSNDNNAGMYISGPIKMSGVHVIRRGLATIWNFPAILIFGSATLVDCIGEQQCTPNTLDRYHGIKIIHAATGTSVYPTLIRCTGIGSPNGCNDVRGIYIDWGANATLIDCKGYGGGIKRGHGIVCHAQSNSVLINCVGYDGSTVTDALPSSGIRFQAITNTKAFGCIGYASDIENSHGISAGFRTTPTLIDCIGVSGKNQNSNGLHIADNSHPRVIGGMYGAMNNEFEWNYDDANDGRFRPIASYPYYVTNLFLWVNIAHVGETVDIGTTPGGHEIAENVSIAVATHVTPVFVPTEIAADGYIYVTPSTAIADNALTVELMYMYNSPGCHALKNESDGPVVIDGAHFIAAPASDCAYIDNLALATKAFEIWNARFECKDAAMNALDLESATTDVPIFNTRLIGTANNVTSYATNPNVNR